WMLLSMLGIMWLHWIYHHSDYPIKVLILLIRTQIMPITLLVSWIIWRLNQQVLSGIAWVAVWRVILSLITLNTLTIWFSWLGAFLRAFVIRMQMKMIRKAHLLAF